MHGHHMDMFVYFLYDTVLKYFNFRKRVSSEERQTCPAHNATGSDPPTLLDVSFRWWKSHLSLGMILCDVWCNIPSNILWCTKKLIENYLKKKHFSESAAICSDFMVFVHHSHQENNTTQLDLVQKARAEKERSWISPGTFQLRNPTHILK